MTRAQWFPQHRPDAFAPVGQNSSDDRPWERLLAAIRPDEGFVGLALVLILAGTLGWSLADARWILGRDDLTSFLIWAAVAAAFWGYLSSRLHISPWLAQTLGCVIGAFVLIELVGMRIPGASPTLGGWFNATANSVTEAYLDLTWRHQLQTLQYGHFCLILGILVWGTAQAASYDVFGYHRAVNGVLLLAVALIANMDLTKHDQFQALVVFCATALVLLLLSHAADERSNWIRHRIWRGHDFQAPHLQGGLAFAGMAIAGALILTTIASSAPLSSFVKVDPEQLSWLQGWLPNGGESRYQPGSDFTSTMTISSVFRPTNADVFTARVSSDVGLVRWRIVSYDDFQTNGWSIGSSSEDQVLAGSSLDQQTADQVNTNTPSRANTQITIHVQDPSLKHLVVTNEPDTVTVSTTRTVVGSGGETNVAMWATSATDYVINAMVPQVDGTSASLTEWRLQNAGTSFPAWLLARYTQGTDRVGEQGRALLAEIQSWASAQGYKFGDEFDAAKAIQEFLRSSSNFSYSTDISGLVSQCSALSTVDCFATIKTGFCEQYATTMTMLMRMSGFPARYVVGYLPGAEDKNTRVQQMTTQQKHAWVEVYFPDYGWIPFDPTGSVGVPTVLPKGSAVTNTPRPSIRVQAPTPRPSSPAGSSANQNNQQGGDNLPATMLIFGGLVVALAMVLLVGLRRQRPGRYEEPATVYRRMVRMASRLGYRPRPTQTVYEYTGMLADVLPDARDSLGVVARATVEVQYGKRELPSPRLMALTRAYESIRMALLRLFIHRPQLIATRGRPEKPAKGPRRSQR